MLIFLFHAWEWFLGDFYRILGHLTQQLTPFECILTDHGGTPSSMPAEQEKSRKFRNQPEPRPDRSELVTANLFIFLHYADEDALFATLKRVF